MTENLEMKHAVLRLQEMLSALGKDRLWLPELTEDGVFDEQTLEAVMLLQRELELPVTGKVDRRTWNAIRSLWNMEQNRKGSGRPARMVPGKGILVGKGEQSDFFAVQQTMFRLLGERFERLSRGRGDGVNDEDSQSDLRWLQRAAGLEETGEMDHDTWEMLTRLYETVVVGEQATLPKPARGGWG